MDARFMPRPVPTAHHAAAAAGPVTAGNAVCAGGHLIGGRQGSPGIQAGGPLTTDRSIPAGGRPERQRRSARADLGAHPHGTAPNG